MNIRELAAYCKLSISSVSRALNNPLEKAQMSAKTYERVHEAARELGYRPNYYAKAFHKKASGCIGFIGGSGMNYIGVSLLEGISDAIDSREMTTYTSATRNDLRREINAFDKMFYRNVDAVIFLPSLQTGKYQTDHLAKLLKNNPIHPPVLSLLGGVELPGMFELRMNDAEAARTAALRQLRLGCRKFGIINTILGSPAEEDAVAAYRETLLEGGVSPRNIKEARIHNTHDEMEYEKLADIDGIWIVYYLLVPSCYHLLSRVCNPQKLHIDTISTLENDELLSWLQMDISSAKRICDYFASLNVFQYSSYQIGVQAGEMVLHMIDNPSLAPYCRRLDWNEFSTPDGCAR